MSKFLTGILLASSLAVSSLFSSPLPGLSGQASAAAAAPALTGSAEAMVKYRHTQMELMGRHSKALRMILKGEVALTDDIAGHAAALNALSQNIPAMFPAGTGPDKLKSEAKPAVWAQWAKFEEASNTMKSAAGKLLEVSKGKDMAALNSAMGDVGKACGNCHDAFKVED